MNNRCSRACILPPTVLERIALNGTDAQREWAVRALLRDQSIRMARLQNTKVRGRGPREGADALAVHAQPTMHRTIRDAAGSESVQGRVARKEGDPPTDDPAVNEAYDGLGDTYRFFLEVYRRNSIDDEGMPLRGVVHFGEDYPNAFWDGRRMVFGDGDGVLFSRLTGSLDVIGHELSHGLTEDESGLEYFGQSGALNESMSDVFGSLVKQHKLDQDADEADWLIGSDVFSPDIQGDALRSMKAPGTAFDDPTLGKDPQPGHMDDYVETVQDQGGVHINSGIPNRAFFIAATSLGGRAWERAGRIWYETLRHSQLQPTANFSTFSGLTMRVAMGLFGPGSEEVTAVQSGWEEVGVGVGEV